MSDPSLIVVRDEALPLTHVSIITHPGSLLDPPGKEGCLRLLLRLMRRSVIGMTTEELDEELDGMGGTFGGEVNRSVAGFHGGVISRSREAFFDLITQIVASPGFDEAEFERLKAESLAEWTESLDSDSTVVRRAFARNLFPGHPYSRLAGGTPETLRRVTLADLKRSHEQIFQQNQLNFALAGDVEEKTARKLSETIDARLPHGSPPVVELDDPQMPSGRRLIFVDKPSRTQTQILIGGLGSHAHDADHTALSVANTIFGGTFSARLSREVRGKRGWSYGASSSLPLDKKRQAFTMWTFPQASDAAACIRLQLSMLEELIEKGITKKELQAATKYITNSHAFSVDTAAKRASLSLDEKVYELPTGYYRGHVARVKALSVDDVNAALKNRLSADNLLIAILGTKKELLTSVQDSIEDLQSTQELAFNEES